MTEQGSYCGELGAHMELTDNRSIIRKHLITFVVVAYGLSFLMMIPMYIGKQNGLDVTQAVDAMMCSPAAGVALGFLLFYKDEKRVPKMFMWVLVINYVVQLLLGILSLVANPFAPDEMITLEEGVDFPIGTIYLLIGQLALIAGSVLLWIGYFIAKKEGRRFAGLSRNNEKKGIVLILLFIGLYMVRIFAPVILDGAVNGKMSEYACQYSELLKNPLFYLALVSTPFNYPLVIIAFLGEEYGWRGFLQPLMQKKFGMRLGVILLGVVWGLWHIPADTLFYTNDSAVQMILGQIITCVAMGIFFGYAYLKTNNIWIPVAMHFLNNNLMPVLSGALSADVLQEQHVTWQDLVLILIIDLIVFCPFILTKVYKEKKENKEAVNA